jgi:DNA-binding winged helix-turn-helix (wHTH) protein
VTKEELLKAIWPDVIVTDHVLINCVAEVRQAIGVDDGAMVKTIPRRGYRFTVPVLRVATTCDLPARSRCSSTSTVALMLATFPTPHRVIAERRQMSGWGNGSARR